ncbi:MAG: DUF922 domain-containing protein [Acidobacteria bacterium]|nr:DUF922 domain-containing protein [Acidobacteriota bacterium]
MKTVILLIALALFSLLPAAAQTANGTEIGDRELEWSDFNGAVDRTSAYDAFTYWFTTYRFGPPVFEDGRARVTVTVRLFLRSDSWVKPGRETARLLNHERGHYKIGRLCAREIAEKINSTLFDRVNYAKEVDAVYWEITRKYQEINRQYDRETDHYNNRAEQERWDKKLDGLLGR